MSKRKTDRDEIPPHVLRAMLEPRIVAENARSPASATRRAPAVQIVGDPFADAFQDASDRHMERKLRFAKLWEHYLLLHGHAA